MSLCRYSEDAQMCTRLEDHEGGHILVPDTVVERFLAIAARFPIEPELLDRIETHEGEPLPMGHHFIGVRNHPDDDECTFREDGTNATYCGEPEAAHYPTEQESEG